MPKDPARNIDRYKIRGGQFNEFDFNRQQNELSQEQEEQSEQGRDFPIPSEQAKAERIKKLLAKYGESVPGEQKTEEQPKPVEPAKPTKPAKGAKAAKPTKPTKKSTSSTKSKSKPSAKPAKRSATKSTQRQAAKSTSQKGGRKAVPRRSTTKTRGGQSARRGRG
jgi:hypothetical protein